MFEIVMIIAATVAAARMADFEGRSQLLWGAVALGVTLLCVFVLPWGLLRVALGFVVVVVLMTASKALAR